MKKYLLIGLVFAAMLIGVVQQTNLFSQVEKSASRAGWLVYTNTTHGYSLEYPADWKIDTAYANEAAGINTEPSCSVFGPSLVIENDQASWIFFINNSGPVWGDSSCPNGGMCSQHEKTLSSLGYQTERRIEQDDMTGKILKGINTFGTLETDGSAAAACFGGDAKYRIVYEGEDLTSNIHILDEITSSLKPLK